MDHPIIRQKISILRDKDTSHRLFREQISDLSYIMCLNAAAEFPVEEYALKTPLAPSTGYRIKPRVGLVPILRAGLGMVDSALRLFPDAEVYHIGIYRDRHSLQPVEYYNKLPENSSVDVCFILEPVIATGGTAIATINVLKSWGAAKIKVINILAVQSAIDKLKASHPDVDVYSCAIDKELSAKGIIIPGLGDAGDRQFATERTGEL